MDVLRLYQDHSVNYRTHGHKHARRGWVNVPCPFCTGHAGYHLGWNINEEYFFCWRCGWHPPITTLSEILHMNFKEVQEIVPRYGINRSMVKYKEREKETLRFPLGMTALTEEHKEYLRKVRHFNPNKIERLWDIKSLGPTATLDGSDYRFRIFIPYKWNGEIGTFDTRDVTDKQDDKYKACPKHLELFERKDILYGNQEMWTPMGICVEGALDVWRLGQQSFATSGIQFTTKQVRLMSQIFKFIWIVYDPESEAQKQAKRLKAELAMRNVPSEIVILPNGKDPGDLTDKEAKIFVNSLKERYDKRTI